MIGMPSDFDDEEKKNDKAYDDYLERNDEIKKKVIDQLDMLEVKLNQILRQQEFYLDKLAEYGATLTLLENEITKLKQNT